MTKYLTFLAAILLGFGAFAQFGNADVLMHFQVPPGNPPPWPRAFGAELLIFPTSSTSENYLTVGTMQDGNTGDQFPVLLQMDESFSPSILKQITLQGADNVNGTAICQSSSGDIFLGIFFFNSGNNTAYKYLVKTDATGNTLWCQYMGEGNIKELVYDAISDNVIVYGEDNDRLFLSSIDATSGVQNWGFAYTGNPGGPINRAGAVLIDPADDQIIIVGTNLVNSSDHDIIAFKVDRSTGVPIWDRRYIRQGTERVSCAKMLNSTLTLAGKLDGTDVLTMNIDPSNGNLNWTTGHNAVDTKFEVSDIDFNPGNQQYFLVGGLTIGGNYREGLVMPVTSTGGNLGYFYAYSTAYFPGPFPYQADYWFTDIDVDSYTSLSTYEMIMTGTGSFNGTSSFNGGMWLMRSDMSGLNPQSCPKTHDSDGYNIQMTVGDGIYFYDGIFATPVPIGDVDIIHDAHYDCNYINKAENDGNWSENAAEASIYPNPANDWVNVALNTDEAAEISVTDLQGRLYDLKRESGSNTVRINLASLSAGIYLIHIEQAGQVTTQKIMVE